MDKSKAHDTLHMWNGGKSESCPVCSGTLTTDEEIVTEAVKIAAEQFHPTVNPMISFDNTVFADEYGGPICQDTSLSSFRWLVPLSH